LFEATKKEVIMTEIQIGHLTFTCTAEKCRRNFTCINLKKPETPMLQQSTCPYLGAYALDHPDRIKDPAREKAISMAVENLGKRLEKEVIIR